MSGKTASKNAPVVHILLPVCTESEFDIFLDILRCYVAHSKLNENHLIEAFISGMKGENFAVEMDDLTLNWKELKSNKQQIQQFKLLGFWVIANFPSFWRKLLGKTHQAPQRDGASVIGKTKINADNIDELVFKKLKVRVMELRVSTSTFLKLNHFVRVPDWVGVKWRNEVNISRKIASFDVDADFVESCWDALRCGEFSMTLDVKQQVHTVMYPFVTTVMDNQIRDSEDTRTTKRLCRRNFENGGAMNTSSVNDLDRERAENNESGSNIDPQMGSQTGISYRRYPISDRTNSSRVYAGELDVDTNIGSLRTIILQLRDDIGTLSKSIQDKKDDEMVKINALANENLIDNRMDLEKKIEDQTAVIIALQKGIDANMSLNEKYKSDIAAYIGSNELLKIEMDRLSTKLTEAEKVVASKQKLEDEFASLKSSSFGVEVELRKEIEATVNLSEKYRSDLEASLESNKLLEIKMERLGRKLSEAENETASNKTELHKLNDLNISIKEKYQRSLIFNEQLKIEVETLSRRLAESDKAVASNVSVNNEVALLKCKSDSIMAKLNSKIECLVKVNSESTKQNEQLKLELKKYAERQKSDVVTQTGESEKTGESNDDLLSGYGASSINHTLSDSKGIGNQEKKSDPVSVFGTENIRRDLCGLNFGWMKFKNTKKFIPGFIHPPGKDGKRKAQWIIPSGNASSKKKEYFEFDDNLPEDQKEPSEKLALGKFNKKFEFDYK